MLYNPIDEYQRESLAWDMLKLLERKFLPVTKCSFCDYQCGFYVLNGRSFYDSGCHCTYTPYNPSERDMYEVVNYMALNSFTKEIIIPKLLPIEEVYNVPSKEHLASIEVVDDESQGNDS